MVPYKIGEKVQIMTTGVVVGPGDTPNRTSIEVEENGKKVNALIPDNWCLAESTPCQEGSTLALDRPFQVGDTVEVTFPHYCFGRMVLREKVVKAWDNQVVICPAENNGLEMVLPASVCKLVEECAPDPPLQKGWRPGLETSPFVTLEPQDPAPIKFREFL
jgi:hypothetical protein